MESSSAISTAPHGRRDGNSEHLATLLLVLEFLLVLSVWRCRGWFGPRSLTFLTATFLWCWAVFWMHRPGTLPAASWLVLAGGCLCAVVLVADLALFDPLLHPVSAPGVVPAVLPVVGAGLLAAGWWQGRCRVGRAALAGGVVCFGLLLAGHLLRTPEPLMDVWSITTEAARALLDGRNPYRLLYTDIYQQAGLPGYGYEMRFIYLPGHLLHAALPAAFGLDVRWVNLLALAAGLALFAGVAARGHGRGGGPVARLTAGVAVLIFWFHGGQPYLLEQCWPEAMLLLYLCLVLWAWRRSAAAAGLALVLALTLKQTAWLCVPFLGALAVAERRWRSMAAVAAGVAVVVAPFFLWDPAAFFHNVVVDLLEKPPRPDALSWAAVALRYFPSAFRPVTALSFVAYAAALAMLVFRLRTRPREEWPAATHRWMTLGLFGLFLFLKQAFFNYYFLVAGLLAFYLAVRSWAPERPDGRPAVSGADSRTT